MSSSDSQTLKPKAAKRVRPEQLSAPESLSSSSREGLRGASPIDMLPISSSISQGLEVDAAGAWQRKARGRLSLTSSHSDSKAQRLWCRHGAVVQALGYDAGTGVWCRHRAMVQVLGYGAGDRL